MHIPKVELARTAKWGRWEKIVYDNSYNKDYGDAIYQETIIVERP